MPGINNRRRLILKERSGIFLAGSRVLDRRRKDAVGGEKEDKTQRVINGLGLRGEEKNARGWGQDRASCSRFVGQNRRHEGRLRQRGRKR